MILMLAVWVKSCSALQVAVVRKAYITSYGHVWQVTYQLGILHRRICLLLLLA